MSKPIPEIKCPHCKGKGTVKNEIAIGAQLLEEREKARTKGGRKIRGTDVAKEMGLSKAMLWDMEQGRRAGWTPDRIKAHRDAVKKLKAQE